MKENKGIHRSTSEQSSIKFELQKLIASFGREKVEQLLPTMGLRIEDNTKLIEQIPNDLSIEEALESFYEGENSLFHGFASATKRTYLSEGSVLRKFCSKNFKDGSNASIKMLFTPLTMTHYLSTVKKQRTANKRRSFLRGLLKHSHSYIEDKKIDLLLSGSLKLSTKDIDHEPKALLEIQVKELLDLSRKTCNALRNHAILTVYLGSGMRLNEIHFTIGDMNSDDRSVMIRRKGRKNMLDKSYLSPEAWEVLVNYVDFMFPFSAPSQIVFPLSDSAIQKMFEDLVSKANTIPDGVKNLYSVHNLRHTFAIQCLKSGIDIFTISKYLGHKSVASTEIYLRVLAEDLREAMNQLKLPLIDLRYLKGGTV